MLRRWLNAARAECYQAWVSAWVPERPGPEQAWRLTYSHARLVSRLGATSRILTARPPPTLDLPRQPACIAGRPRVLHLVDGLGLGGTEKIVVDLMRGLASDFEMAVATGGVRYFAGFRHPQVHVVAGKAFDDLLRRYAPSVVHAHYWGAGSWIEHALDRVHALCPAVPVIDNANNPIAAWNHPAIAHHVFVSQHAKDLQASAFTSSSIIHPGVDLTEWKARTSPLPRDTVGSVYRLEDDKLSPDTIEIFIELVKRRPQTRILLVGHGSNFHRYVARAEAEGVRRHFEFAGRVPARDLPGWYDRFSLFCAPVRQESYGVVVPYAMAKSIPVVGFHAGALPELLGSDATLARSPSELVEKMATLLDDPARLEAVGAPGRQRVAEHFSLDAMLDAYRSLYRTLLAGAGEP